jgi:hypothetical protein
MVDLDRLRVSLTKNGYMKIAVLVRHHPRWEVLENVSGKHAGVNLIRSQVANIMGEDAAGEPPEFWDEIRSHGERAIDAFVLVALIMSHTDLIGLLKRSAQGHMKGHLERGTIGEKAYTNLVFALASCGLCDYQRGAEAVNYDMRGLIFALRKCGQVVRQLIAFKLAKCGWRPPERPGGVDFFDECEANGLHQVFGLEPEEFRDWLRGRLRIEPPAEQGTGLPRKPR